MSASLTVSLTRVTLATNVVLIVLAPVALKAYVKAWAALLATEQDVLAVTDLPVISLQAQTVQFVHQTALHARALIAISLRTVLRRALVPTARPMRTTAATDAIILHAARGAVAIAVYLAITMDAIACLGYSATSALVTVSTALPPLASPAGSLAILVVLRLARA